MLSNYSNVDDSVFPGFFSTSFISIFKPRVGTFYSSNAHGATAANSKTEWILCTTSCWPLEFQSLISISDGSWDERSKGLLEVPWQALLAPCCISTFPVHLCKASILRAMLLTNASLCFIVLLSQTGASAARLKCLFSIWVLWPSGNVLSSRNIACSLLCT